MKQYILDFITKFNYPEPAVSALLGTFDVLKACTEFDYIIANYYTDDNINEDSTEGLLYSLCENNDIDFFTGKLLLYICLSATLKKKYFESGYSEEFWYENMEDLKTKMLECYDVHKIWGLFSKGWFPSVFRLETFALGRMSYNIGEYDGEDIVIAGQTITKGDKLINVHIPSSGKPFDKEARLESYKRAHDFFGVSLFRCSSWLIYPPNGKILSDKSNIVSFMNDFKIVDSYEYEDDHIMWRIFGKSYNLPANELPRNSSLQKAYADFIMNGNKLGAGTGYFIFDATNNDILK